MTTKTTECAGLEVAAFCFYHLAAGGVEADQCEVGYLADSEECELEPAVIHRKTTP
jgi:hypothetical protein